MIYTRTQAVQDDITHAWHPITDQQKFVTSNFPVIARGEGSYLFDANGKKYFDGISSWWCVNLGHGNKKIIKAIKQQADILQHSMFGGMTNMEAAKASANICSIMPSSLTRVFFASDGTSATEISIKMALKFWSNKGIQNKNKFFSLEGSYHGDSMGAVSLGYVPRFHAELKGLMQEAIKIPIEAKNVRSIFEKHHKEVAALVIEPLCQGANCINFYSVNFVQQLASLCKEFDILLIADEIAVGFGRLGEMFACQIANITPDIMLIGKGMSAGYLPISAAVATEKVYEAFFGGELKKMYHSNTFAGNPLCCAAVNAAIEVYKQTNIGSLYKNTMCHIYKILVQKLQVAFFSLKGTKVDQLGFIIAIRLNEEYLQKIPKIQLFCQENGVMIRPIGNVIYLWPPLTSTKKELTEAVNIICKAVQGT